MEKLADITSFLDRELDISAFPDESNNGLQVANSGRVERICAGVCASLEFLEKAADAGADMVICHHGVSWGDSLKTITGVIYRKIKLLAENDIALYACHLPLDAHPEYGNNSLILKGLGMESLKPFGGAGGLKFGFSGTLRGHCPLPGFIEKARALFGRPPETMNFGKEKIKTAAAVSGSGAGFIAEAAEEGIDVFISGEPGLKAYNEAREHGINCIFAGHYSTETFGARRLACLLEEKFSVRAEFIDLGIKL